VAGFLIFANEKQHRFQPFDCGQEEKNGEQPRYPPVLPAEQQRCEHAHYCEKEDASAIEVGGKQDGTADYRQAR